MPLLSFSEPTHIIPLLEGTKQQTTRPPRKRPLKIEDTLYCYYKSRMKKACVNCINQSCPSWVPSKRYTSFKDLCDDTRLIHHKNFFGEAVITELVNAETIRESDSGFTSKYIFDYMTSDDREQWAVNDGFDSLDKADEWFSKRYGPNWMHSELEITKFKPGWLNMNISLDCFIFPYSALIPLCSSEEAECP